jgi:hypothetical protein
LLMRSSWIQDDFLVEALQLLRRGSGHRALHKKSFYVFLVSGCHCLDEYL